jgi:hypothetical protein
MGNLLLLINHIRRVLTGTNDSTNQTKQPSNEDSNDQHSNKINEWRLVWQDGQVGPSRFYSIPGTCNNVNIWVIGVGP